MDFRVRLLSAALLVFAAGGHAAQATEPETWYVYCEGASADGHWAVFSENFWLHPETAGYARLVGNAAKAFFESRHDVSLEGCAGVNFRDGSLAEHSRSMTAQLHRRMGDRIYFLRLPAEVLPAEIPPEILPAAAVTPARAARQADRSRAEGQAVRQEWSPSRPPR